LLNGEEFLYLLSFFNSVLLRVDVLYNTIQKLSANAQNIRTAIQHFETAINVPRSTRNLLELERNSERAWKDVNTSAEAKGACDIIVNQMEHRFEEAHHTTSFIN
jgi:predicted nucleic acid-binding protein